jgi:hypothetical protein
MNDFHRSHPAQQAASRRSQSATIGGFMAESTQPSFSRAQLSRHAAFAGEGPPMAHPACPSSEVKKTQRSTDRPRTLAILQN